MTSTASPALASKAAFGPVGLATSRIFLANLVANVAIVITGGAVRLSESGLGCPTWPDCVEGSLVPTSSQIEGIHKVIEFGNRLLTFVIAIIAIAAIVAAFRDHRRRRRAGTTTRPVLVWLSAGTLIGIFGQAVLGGITVLTGLNPVTVAAHFLLSMALIASSYLLWVRGREAGDHPVFITVRSEIRKACWALVAAAVVVLILGTVVTGTGPHSGDAHTPTRFGFDWRTVSWLHADSVLVFLGLTVAIALALRVTDAPARANRAIVTLLAVSLAQGVLGYAQYFLKVPELLVALHMLGACLVWIATLSVLVSTRLRGEQSRDVTPAAQSV